MSNIFQKLEIEAFRKGITPRSKESMDWFRKKAATLRGINRESLMDQDPLQRSSGPKPGAMGMFFYDPKHKDTLPYYDTFPLVIFVEPAKGGFYGLNLHYLPPTLRARLLDGLMDNTNNKKYDESTRMQANYNLLKAASGNVKYFKPCFKHYLTGHVKSKFAIVPAPEWEIAAFLPTAQFKKASTSKVYADSRRMI